MSGVRRFRATVTRERLYQFASRAALPSELREGYQASLFLRFSGWPAGARRRGNDERKLRSAPLRIVQCARRSLRTALGTELEADLRRRMETSETVQLRRTWDTADVGLTPNSWSHFPKAPAASLAPFLLEMRHTEVLISFPNLSSHPAAAKRHTSQGRPPPPSPHIPESSWDTGRAPAEDRTEPEENFALQELAGVDLLGMFQGSQRAVTVSFFLF